MSLEQAVEQLDDPAVERLNKTLLNQIELMTRRIEYAESRRGAIATFASGLFAGGVALLALPIDLSSPPIPHPLVIRLFGFSLTLFSIVTLIAWSRQINPPYGFIQGVGPRPWKWFYRDALTNHNAFTLKWWWSAEQAPITAFREQWDPFARQSLGLADLRTDTLQNLQQVYLLHVNERYKNLFLSQLRSLLLATVIGPVVIAVAAAVTLAVVIPSWPGPSTTPAPSVTNTPSADESRSAAPSATSTTTAPPTQVPGSSTPSSTP